MILTLTKKDINAITGFGRKVGNGAHVMIPKDWIGVELIIRPLFKEQKEMADQYLSGLHIRKGRRKK